MEYLSYKYLYAAVPGVEMAVLCWKGLFQEHRGKDDKQQGVVSGLLSIQESSAECSDTNLQQLRKDVRAACWKQVGEFYQCSHNSCPGTFCEACGNSRLVSDHEPSLQKWLQAAAQRRIRARKT